MDVVRAFTKLGVAGTFRSLFRSRHAKIGALVGQDKYGNKYFENTKDYPWGQHRWVEYAGGKNFYENDASFVPPEWHGWLHHTTDDVPTEVRERARRSHTASVHSRPPIWRARTRPPCCPFA